MAAIKQNRLIILSGPSCVGKSPLDKALARLFPEIHKDLQALVLYNSRAPRPGERDGVDYHFRTEDQVTALGSQSGYVVMNVRGDIQALDLEELGKQLESGNVFFEGNPFVGEALLTHKSLVSVDKLGIFMSPLSRDEITTLKDQGVNLSSLITDVMRRKLLRRTRRQKGELSLKDLENIEKRAASAYSELQKAHLFQHVLVNHDGEDSEHWDAFYYPLGDARIALLGFVSLLNGEQAEGIESWDEQLLTRSAS